MTFLLYIGKNKDFLRKFSKLENVQMIYAKTTRMPLQFVSG